MVYVRWILFLMVRSKFGEKTTVWMYKSLINNGISTTFTSTGEPVNPGFLVAINSRLTIATIVSILGGGFNPFEKY